MMNDAASMCSCRCGGRRGPAIGGVRLLSRHDRAVAAQGYTYDSAVQPWVTDPSFGCCCQQLWQASEGSFVPYVYSAADGETPWTMEACNACVTVLAGEAPNYACTPWGPPVPPSMEYRTSAVS